MESSSSDAETTSKEPPKEEEEPEVEEEEEEEEKDQMTAQENVTNMLRIILKCCHANLGFFDSPTPHTLSCLLYLCHKVIKGSFINDFTQRGRKRVGGKC